MEQELEQDMEQEMEHEEEGEHEQYFLQHEWLQFEHGSEARRRLEKFSRMTHGRSAAIDWGFIQHLGDRDVAEAIVGQATPFRRLFDLAFLPCYRELTLEFICTFHFRIPPSAPLDHPDTVSFRLGGQPHRLSPATFGVLVGLYSLEETQTPLFLQGRVDQDDVVILQWWQQIADGPFAYGPRAESKARVSSIRDPLHR